ncbi:MAG: hypothetical protein IJ164_00260 [Duodenibacillus sp.]|nr:hypothetical protein [Duodenibacillus sp.]
MRMTIYMAILAEHQPWNLLAFMVLPMLLAEAVVAGELFLLAADREKTARSLKAFVAMSGIALFLVCVTLVILGCVMYAGRFDFQSAIDAFAIVAYVLAVIPAGMTAYFGMKLDRTHVRPHIISLIVYLALAHLAMVFGMLDPLLGQEPAQDHMHHQEMVVEHNPEPAFVEPQVRDRQTLPETSADRAAYSCSSTAAGCSSSADPHANHHEQHIHH